jgi:arylsulfatase A-like enzyme
MKKTLFLFLLVGLSLAQAQPTKRPNILFLIADDWSKHAGIYGTAAIRTPHIDRLGRDGVIFENAFCAAPSCTPSRASILTGRYPHQNIESVNLWSTLQTRLPNYTTLLQTNGYHVGLERKGWGPGNFTVGGYAHNPAGKSYPNFAAFLAAKPEGQPFCYWFGTQDPHRPYTEGSGAASGLDLSKIKVPSYLPDSPVTRSDLADYMHEVERFDREIGELLAQLEARGELDNTVIVLTSDNGLPFPRAKATLYDSGTNMPLIFYWKNTIQPARSRAFVNFIDLAPTFLSFAQLPIPKEMTGKSFANLLLGKTTTHRPHVFLERERHAHVRQGNLSYPARALRTERFLYIQNLLPDRWPAGDPRKIHSVGSYGDVDEGPAKSLILSDTIVYSQFYQWAFGKRPTEELYDLRTDPDQLQNRANDPAYRTELARLRRKLRQWQKQTQDPRGRSEGEQIEQYPYYGQLPAQKSEENRRKQS